MHKNNYIRQPFHCGNIHYFTMIYPVTDIRKILLIFSGPVHRAKLDPEAPSQFLLIEMDLAMYRTENCSVPVGSGRKVVNLKRISLVARQLSVADTFVAMGGGGGYDVLGVPSPLLIRYVSKCFVRKIPGNWKLDLFTEQSM